MIKRKWVAFGTEYYPTADAHEGGKQLGKTPLKRCVQCGHPNDTRSTTWSDKTDQTGNDNDSGCAFCKSAYWLKGKPKALPDDRFLPSDEKDRRRRRK